MRNVAVRSLKVVIVIILIILLIFLAYLKLRETYNLFEPSFPELVALKQQLVQHPQDSVLLKKIGNIFLENNAPSDAMWYYRKALHLKPDYAEVYNNIGVIYTRQKHYDQAISNFKTAISLDQQDSSDAYNNLAMAYIYTVRVPLAIDALVASIVLNNHNFNAYKNLGLLYLQIGKEADALAVWQKALALKEDPSILHQVELLRKSVPAK